MSPGILGTYGNLYDLTAANIYKENEITFMIGIVVLILLTKIICMTQQPQRQ